MVSFNRNPIVLIGIGNPLNIKKLMGTIKILLLLLNFSFPLFANFSFLWVPNSVLKLYFDVNPIKA